ncbi:hypothetical protein TNCV_1066121 [Trichonephila clavipes]|nr:hypothetical protein TNCV_1066121 [Trichonephila clavipes]
MFRRLSVVPSVMNLFLWTTAQHVIETLAVPGLSLRPGEGYSASRICAMARSPVSVPLKMWRGCFWGGRVAGRNHPPTNKNTPHRVPHEEIRDQNCLNSCWIMLAAKYGTTCGMLHHAPRWTYPVLIRFL